METIWLNSDLTVEYLSRDISLCADYHYKKGASAPRETGGPPAEPDSPADIEIVCLRLYLVGQRSPPYLSAGFITLPVKILTELQIEAIRGKIEEFEHERGV
jgi:hypothetical protein